MKNSFDEARSNNVDIAIVGQGYSAISAFYNLIDEIKQSDDPSAFKGAKIAWMDPACADDAGLEPRDRIAMGAIFKEGLPDCYKTTTPAWTQSLIGDDIGDFTKWLQQENPEATADTFTNRSDVARYLRQRVGEALADAKGLGIEVQLVKASVNEIVKSPDGVLKVKASGKDGLGTEYEAAQVIMATGHKMRTPEWAKDIQNSQNYVATPSWYDKMKDVVNADNITLVGFGNSGLEAVRVLNSLGYKGTITVVSPRQKLGFAIDHHDPYHPTPLAQADDHAVLPESSAKDMPNLPASFFDGLKAEMDGASGSSIGDKVVAVSEYFYKVQIESDALKSSDPQNPGAFFPNNMPSEEEFLGELEKRGVDKKTAQAVAGIGEYYAYDCMEPEGIALVRKMREEGRFKYEYGHLDGVDGEKNDGLSIQVRRPSGVVETIDSAGPIVNCSPWQRGIMTNEGRDPLFASLQEQGLITIGQDNLATAKKNSGISIVGAAGMQHWGIHEIAEEAKGKVEQTIKPRLERDVARHAQSYIPHVPDAEVGGIRNGA